MRMMMKVSLAGEAANPAIVHGSLGPTIQRILEELRPEAAYFGAENGERTAYLFFDMQDSSQIPAVAEPWFLAFNAKVSFQPVMNAQDLAASAPGMEHAVKGFSKA